MPKQRLMATKKSPAVSRSNRRGVRKTRTAPKPKTEKRVPQPIGPWLAAAAMMQNIRPMDMTIFDVGAHFGSVTEMLRRIWPKSRVYCFEPEKEGIATLHRKFDGDDRITVIPAALGRKCETRTLYIGGQRKEMSSLYPRPSEGRQYYRHELKDKDRVSVLTIDDFMEEEPVEHIHLMKVDVQGGEKDVIKGASAALTNQKIDLVYMEVLFVEIYKGNALFHQLCAQMARFDYRLFDIYNLQRSWINRQLKYGDAMWVSPKIRETRLDTYPPDWLARSLDQRMCPNR